MEDHCEVRRLDEMGRLVIPKPMRKILRWYGGDPVLLTLRGRDSLLLHSYPRMQALRPLVAEYADAFYATYHTPIAICDREQILVHRGFTLSGQPPLSDPVRSLLETVLSPTVNLPPLQLQRGCEPAVTGFLPLRPEAAAIGGILLGKSDSHTQEQLLEAGQLLARMITTQV